MNFHTDDKAYLTKPRVYIGTQTTFDVIFLSISSSKARASGDHFFHFFPVFLSLDFRELWYNMMSTCIIPEVKQQWATLVFG